MSPVVEGIERAGVTVLPPARRGDVAALVARFTPRTLVLVDGVFHQVLAVGHVELRDAIAAGWTVWGLSSMGAIRAREMQHMGMRGFGEVFSRFCEPGDFRDDEVTLLHTPGPEYRELSEPMVHLRVALDDLSARGAISSAQARDIRDHLLGRYFGDRTLALFARLLREHGAEIEPDDRPGEVSWPGFDRYRIKCHDLIRFIDEVIDASGAEGGALNHPR